MTEEVKKYLKKADHALKVADKLLQDGFAADAASKAYYAMFYTAQALLKSEGIDVVKHSRVESELGYRFAKPGKLDVKYHRMLIDARKLREQADYDIDEKVGQSAATTKVEEGKAFLTAAKLILGV